MSVKEHCCHKNTWTEPSCDREVSGLVFLKVKISNYGKYSLVETGRLEVSDLIKF